MEISRRDNHSTGMILYHNYIKDLRHDKRHSDFRPFQLPMLLSAFATLPLEYFALDTLSIRSSHQFLKVMSIEKSVNLFP